MCGRERECVYVWERECVCEREQRREFKKMKKKRRIEEIRIMRNHLLENLYPGLYFFRVSTVQGLP